MTLRRAAPWLVLAVVLGFVGWKLHSSHFDWAGFGASLRTADVRLLVLAVLLIYSGNLFRAMRWAVFLRPGLRAAHLPAVPWWRLVGSQFIGFTGLAIFGRVGELIRPYLVARRARLTFASQIAVVAVERVFDLVAFGLIFALNLLFAPSLQSIPHLRNAAYFIAGMTLVLGALVVAIRLSGGAVAALAARLFGLVSSSAGAKVAEKILSFQQGLNVVDNLADFSLAAVLSFTTWFTIVLAYVAVMKAFPVPVHSLTPAHTIVLMGFSIAGSAVPVPAGSGAWVGNVVALKLFGIPEALATGAALVLWIVTNLAVIPVGLVFARIDGISLGQLAKRTDEAPAAVAARQ